MRESRPSHRAASVAFFIMALSIVIQVVCLVFGIGEKLAFTGVFALGALFLMVSYICAAIEGPSGHSAWGDAASNTSREGSDSE